MVAHDFIDEPLLTVRLVDGARKQLTLPAALAGLSDGTFVEFCKLRTHHFHGWMMFITQLAFLALRRAGVDSLPGSAERWRDLLLELTEQQHEPWCLVVEDLGKAAFFQPPVPDVGRSGRLDESWKALEHPDERDVIVTAKEHDVKSARVRGDSPEAWLYTLCTIQTLQGYPGRGYTPVSRMKGGYGNRPRVGLAPGHSLSGRFKRDLDTMRASTQAWLERGYADKGIALVWTVPWDGKRALQRAQLEPNFVEVCQRLRCVSDRGRVVLQYATSESRRCLPDVETGDIGDPWIPVERGSSKPGALTVGSSGFSYRLVSRLLLSDDFESARAQLPQAGDPPNTLFIAAALTRGQGKTDGLHERVIPIPSEVRRRLGQTDQRQLLGQRSKEFVSRADDMRSKVLYGALKALVPYDADVRDDFDALVDERFFDELFGGLELDNAAARLAWECSLVQLARKEFARACDVCVLGEMHSYKAVSKAEAYFQFGLKKHFPDALAALSASQPAPSPSAPEVSP